MGVFKHIPVDFISACLGIVFILLDVGLDIWAAVSFYQEKAYWSLGVLLLLLIGSSVLVHVYSWLWYSYDGFERQTKVEKCLSLRALKILHVLQLGIYFRHAGVAEISLRRFSSTNQDHRDKALFTRNDLSILRLIETFSESAPQLVLMLAIILQRGELNPVTVGKTIGSALAIAFRLTMHYRLERAILVNQQKQQITTSVIHFTCNLFLISSRITALALFASVLPCLIFIHFLCSWSVLFFIAWRSGTDFMDSPCGERLFQATVALICYFDWFNVGKQRPWLRRPLYHGCTLVDISLLCGLWYWKMSTELPCFKIPLLYAVVTVVCVVGVYILGLLFKMLHHKCSIQSLSTVELGGRTADIKSNRVIAVSADDPDSKLPEPPLSVEAKNVKSHKQSVSVILTGVS
ncbi:XK-related protein 8-like [Plectropomus leopardus]|uniref:XK-related protein 8-like n=1 Tax=Plectropomus leopardus TaxID=160734 RepID=UPI001C4CDF7F|nr:XK-related protein 8-like [Plectropomus leopardus]